MKNYKATDSKMRCQGFQFELGKRYSVEGELKLCKNGFHSCDSIIQLIQFYPLESSRIFEVDIEETISSSDKNCSRHITLLREITLYEGLRLLNFNLDGSPLREDQENTNLGFFNRGNNNRGNDNHGKYNRGNYNWGNNNRGNDNWGNDNRGNNNHGNNNHGNNNRGNDNHGNYNRGNNNHD